MQMKESDKLNQKLTDKIINVAYGNAGIVDRIYIFFKAKADGKANSLLNEYRNTAISVHNLKQEEVPDYIIAKAKSITGGTGQNEFIPSHISYGVFSFLSTKVIPATVLGILFIFIVSFLILREPSPSHKYSKAEIELAEKQLKLSLAIVGKAFQKAEKSFSEEVLNNQINKNLNRGYFLVTNILIGG